MADQRSGGITWTEETWNPIRGCSDVSEGCRHCYAKRQAATRMSGPGQPYHGLAELRNGKPYWTGVLQLDQATLVKPLHWTRPRLVFVNSMSDLFHEYLTDEQIDRVVAVMALAGRHTFQLLTKRAERMHDYLARLARSISPLEQAARDLGFTFNFQGIPLQPWPLPNIWWGVSVEDQKTLDERAAHLVRCRDHAAVLWLSLEPLLGPVQLWNWLPHEIEVSQTRSAWVKGVDWVVAGGESGPDARPMNPAWARRTRDDCLKAGVSYHFKQWGEWGPHLEPESTEGRLVVGGPKTLMIDHQGLGGLAAFPDGTVMKFVGKKAAGRLLDGQLWDQYPSRKAA
jgi:protein gp37